MHAHATLVREAAREHKEHDEQQDNVDQRDDVDLRLFVATGFEVHGRLEIIGGPESSRNSSRRGGRGAG
jgi:hypothetical protein